MKKYLILGLLAVLPIFSSNGANTPAEIENFDIRYYHPANYGLKDLVFEVRVKNLLENLNKNLSLGTLADVYFKVYWMMPGKYKIEVAGLPKGFKEIKSDLKNLIKNRLDFVIPQKLAPKVRSYSLTSRKSKKGVQIIGRDKTHTKAVNEIQLDFNKKGMLSKYKSMSPMGVNSSSIRMSAKGWSHNKWLIDNLKIDTIQGINKITMSHDVDYLSIDGFGFPAKVTITTSSELMKTKKSKARKTSNPVTSEILFSKYEVNTGKAQKQIIQGVRK